MSARLGLSAYKALACHAAGYAVGYGILLTLCTIALSMFARRTSTGCFLPAATLAIFISSTIWFILNLRIAVLKTSVASPSILSRIARLSIAYVVFFRINCVLSDAVVVWRAWVLWPGSRMIRAILALSMLGTIVGSIAEVVLISISSKDTLTTSTPPDSVLWPRFLLSTLPIILTNIIATGITAAKVWEYRSNIKSTLPRKSAPVRVTKILLVSVESGLIYATFWTVTFLVGVADLPATYGLTDPYAPGAVLSNVLPAIASLYPLIIVISSTAQASPAHTIGSLLLSRLRFTPRRRRTVHMDPAVLNITTDADDSFDGALSSLVARPGPDRYRATIDSSH
ncbi:hypothetical protein HDZ31DRAFT_69295 [Schizophyllum fasciatum]